jgi:hypothetical protein
MYFNKNLNNPAMDNDKFKKQSQEILSSFTQDPPDRVWHAINSRLDARKRKRRILFWLFPLSILAGVISIIPEQQTPKIKPDNPQTHQQQSASKANQLPAAEIAERAQGQQETTQLNDVSVQNPSNKASESNPVKTTGKKHKLKEAYADELMQSETENTANPIEAYQSQELPFKALSLVEPVWQSDITSPKPINHYPSVNKDTMIILTCVPQKSKPGKLISWHYSGAYSFHGTGDLEGMQLEWGFSKTINRYFAFYNNVGVSLHGGSVVQPLNLNILVGPSAALPVGQGSVYEITSAIQTAPMLLGSVPATPLRIGVGGLLRYQFYSGGNGYSVQRNQNMQTFTLRDGNYNGLSLGYRVVVGLELLNTKRNKLQFQAGFQNDTRGDVITGLGLSWQYTKQ